MFKSAKPNKIHENIVEQIRKALSEGRLKPGDKLPPEKELIEKFQVSKVTLREAIRSLETLGFLEIRKGLSGGAFVKEIDMQKARESFFNIFVFKNLSLSDLSEVRLILEPYAAEKAALAITDDELETLGKLNKQCEHILSNQISFTLHKNEIEFHRIIGSISRNPILMFILDFIDNILVDANEILKPGKDFSEKVLSAHVQIHKALSERDAKKAREEMIKHVEQVERDLIALQKESGIEELNLQPGVSTERRL